MSDKIYGTWPITEKFSFNKLIVESYKKEALRAQERNGFAFIDQKLGLKGLKVLVSANLVINGASSIIPKDSIAYIREETLHNQPWAQKPMECSAIEGKFLIVDLSYVEFFEPPKND